MPACLAHSAGELATDRCRHGVYPAEELAIAAGLGSIDRTKPIPEIDSAHPGTSKWPSRVRGMAQPGAGNPGPAESG